MKPIYRSNTFMLVIIIGQVLGSAFLSRPLQRLFSDKEFLVVTQVLFLLVPVLLYLLVSGLPAKETLKLNRLSIKDIGIVITIAVVAQPIAMFLSVLSSLFFKNTVVEVMKELGNIPYIIQLGIIALTPAICEELTMRGVILSGYEKVSTRKAALATGLFFGILHMNPQQFLYAFVLGVLFAYLVRITNSIFSTMICHFTFNGIQVTMAYVVSRANPEALNQANNIDKFSILSQLIPISLWAVLASYVIVRLLRYMMRSHEALDRPYSGSFENVQSSIAFRESSWQNNQERIVNAPFIAVVIIYLVLMVILQFLR